MRIPHVVSCLTWAVVLVHISACSSHDDQHQHRLYFAVGDSELVLEPDCLQDASMEKDLQGREFINVGIVESEDCYSALNSWIESHDGDPVRLMFDEKTVSGPSPILGTLPARDVTITSDNQELLSEVYRHISN